MQKDETMENGEWDVVKISSIPKQIGRDGQNYSDLFITIHMERRPQYYFMNIIIPCVIIYCLTLFGFCLPSDSGEKVSEFNVNRAQINKMVTLLHLVDRSLPSEATKLT